MKRIILAFFGVLVFVGCSQVEVGDYSGRKPLLQPEEFFNGHLSAHGVIKDRSGKVIRTFNASIDASWQQGIGKLVEDFVFDDGDRQRRIWILTPGDDGYYSATAGDVVGEALLQVAGNTLFLDYVLRIPYGDDTVDVRVDDRMYLASPDILINESSMSKFGVDVGSILLVILRDPKPLA